MIIDIISIVVWVAVIVCGIVHLVQAIKKR